MSRGKWAVVLVAVLVATAWMGSAFSQERRGWDPEQRRQQYLTRIREALGANEEEWKVLEPKVGKVRTLSQQVTGSGMRALFGRRGGPGPERDRAEMTAVEKATEGLQDTLANADATQADIKAKLKAFRDARAKVKVELAKAQQDLRKAVNLRQEAQLVLIGMLD